MSTYKAKVEVERLRKIIDQIGSLSTGWKHGNEGLHLLRINSLCCGNGATTHTAKDERRIAEG